VNLYSTDHHH